MPQVQRSIVIHVPPEKLLHVINDFASYPEFLPEVKKIIVGNKTATSAEVTYEIDVIKRISYTLKHVLDGQSVRWSLVKGDLMKKNEGSWTLRPEGDGSTHATYTLDVSFGGFIPVPAAITDRLTASSLPTLLENFKKRAEGLFGVGAA